MKKVVKLWVLICIQVRSVRLKVLALYSGEVSKTESISLISHCSTSRRDEFPGAHINSRKIKFIQVAFL